MQYDLFVNRLLEPFAAIDNVASLLDYQERYLQDALPADLTSYECIYLRDYEKARLHALIWQDLEERALNEYMKTAEAAIREADYTNRDRKVKLRQLEYERKCRMHRVYAVQRLIHMIDVGVFDLLQQNIRDWIAAAETAFRKNYPDYRYKE